MSDPAVLLEKVRVRMVEVKVWGSVLDDERVHRHLARLYLDLQALEATLEEMRGEREDST